MIGDVMLIGIARTLGAPTREEDRAHGAPDVVRQSGAGDREDDGRGAQQLYKSAADVTHQISQFDASAVAMSDCLPTPP